MKVREIPKKVFMKLEVDDLEIKSIDDKTRTIWHKITKEVKDRMGDIVRIDGINLKNFFNQIFTTSCNPKGKQIFLVYLSQFKFHA